MLASEGEAYAAARAVDRARDDYDRAVEEDRAADLLARVAKRKVDQTYQAMRAAEQIAVVVLLRMNPASHFATTNACAESPVDAAGRV